MKNYLLISIKNTDETFKFLKIAESDNKNVVEKIIFV